MQCCRWCGMESCDHAFVYRESLPTYARLRLLCERMTPARRYGWPFRWLLSLACLIFIGAALLPGSEVVFASTSAILRVSPTGFWAGGNCTGGGGGWTCMATVRETGSSQDSLNWSASSSLGGVSFTPSGGTLSPGESSMVTIFVPSSDCSYGIFTFTGQTNTVHRVWSCQAAPLPPPQLSQPKLRVSPGSLDPTSARCSRTGDTYQCAVAVRETATSQQDVNWTASSSLNGVSFSQGNGQLSPGSTTQVIITGIPCQNGTFTFAGSGGASPVTVWWSCTPSQLPPSQPPVLTVKPGSLDPTSARCSSTGSTYQCTVLLAETSSSQGNANWTASSNLNGVNFSLASGELSPGNSTREIITGIPCQQGTFTFAWSGGASPVSVLWSCKPSLPVPTAPTLKVSPSSLDASSGQCVSTARTHQCQITLAETSSSQSSANWTASSSLSGVTFSPASGRLSPGGFVTVTIASIPCQSGSFTFAGVEGTMLEKVAWSCSGSSVSLANRDSLSFTSQPTGAVTLNGSDQIVSYTFTFTLNNATTQGWHVVITSTQLTTGSAPYYTLPTTASSVTDVTAVCQSGSCNAPQNQITYPVVVPAGNPAPSPVTFYNSAGNNTGTGTFIVTATIQVVVPGNAYAGTYSSTITVTMATDGP